MKLKSAVCACVAVWLKIWKGIFSMRNSIDLMKPSSTKFAIHSMILVTEFLQKQS